MKEPKDMKDKITEYCLEFIKKDGTTQKEKIKDGKPSYWSRKKNNKI